MHALSTDTRHRPGLQHRPRQAAAPTERTSRGRQGARPAAAREAAGRPGLLRRLGPRAPGTHRRRPVRPDRGSAVTKRRGLSCAPGPHLLQPGDQHRLDPVDVQVAALQLGPEVDDPQLGDLLPFRLPRGGRGCHGPGSGSHFGRAARCRGSEWAAGRRRRRRRQRRWRRWPRQHQLPTRARAASGAALRCAQ